VLCYLQGRTLDQAAAELGVATSALKVRLERARAVLRARLVRRGLAPAALVAAAWPGAAIALPSTLLESAIQTATSAPSSAAVVALTEGVLSAMRITKLKLATSILAILAAVGLSLGGLAQTSPEVGGNENGNRTLAAVQDAQKPGAPKVVREKLTDRHGDEWVRVTGRVKVIDARTLEFDDGKRLEMWIVAPRLNQMAMDGEKLYPAGREAAEFLRKCIGDNPVTCLHEAERNQYAVTAYVGDTSLNELMVVNGWAFSKRIPYPSEFAARDNRRGLWRGQFIDPTDWEAGVRLPGEPPPPRIADEREARKLIATHNGHSAALAAVVERIVKDLPDVRVLDFSRSALSDESCATLAGLKSLEELTLGRNVTDAGLAHLKRLPRLRKLDATWATVSDAGLKHVAHLTELEDFSVEHSRAQSPTARITDEGLNHLKGLKKLRCLSLNSTEATDAFLEYLGTLTELDQLQLWGTKVTDEGLKHLKGLKKLRRLTLHDTPITDAGLGHLSGLTHLEVVELGGTRITNAGLPHLKGFANLAYLDIRNTEVTDTGLEHLWGLQKLQVAYLPHHISDQAWKRFQEAVPTVTGSSFPRVPGDYLSKPVKAKE
jgi:endonuclease YncB( thermonuclease family)/Leucine-rich repeat (LRR) protein